MKKITLMFAAVATMFCTTVNAQLVKNTEGYQRVEASFAKSKAKTEAAAEDMETKGFELGYIKGVNIVNSLPIFLELGGNFTFTHNSEKINTIIGKIESKTSMASIAIPVNAAYKFAFAKAENFTVVPFVGPNFKFNLIGKQKVDDESASFFDEDDMGDNTAKRFQVGLNLGVGVNIAENLYVGYKCQPDLTKYIKFEGTDYNYKTVTNYITIGWNF